MKKIGLYFGTFNPIHVGHLIIANYMADYTELDEVWLVVSPQNPLKKKKMKIGQTEFRIGYSFSDVINPPIELF